MTAEEVISLSRLAKHVDEMAEKMVTQSLLKAEVGRIDSVLSAHIEYTRLAASAEAKRLDSIREVDAMAVKVANDRAVEQAGILAKQVESVASTLRELVSTTASAAAEAQAQLFAPMVTKLQRVEDKQNEDRGKATFADPMLATLVAKMEAVALTLSKTEGKATVTDPMLTALNTKVDALSLVISNNEGKSLGSAHNIVTWSSVLTEWIKPIITAIATAVLVYFVVTSGLAK